MSNKPIFYKSDKGIIINLLEVSCIKPCKPPSDYGSAVTFNNGSQLLLSWGEREKIIDILCKKDNNEIPDKETEK